ncbi:nuclear transport factor 2 family protein [Tenacibaculum sp. Ill]|uniref:nuclear transport factor 2 family protein n=1 Tax=Tenacibaculum sp. Ill TaxID=3445935 RepID=UPI003F7AE3B0
MKKRIVIAVGFATLLSCTLKLQGQIKTDSKMENLKIIAQKAQDAFFTDYDEEGVKKYFAANYIQHNPHVPTGIEPVLGVLPALKEAKTIYTNHRLLQDGEYVVFHNSYHNADAFGAKELVAFDVWRMEDGKVAEHWDNLTSKVNKTASGRSQVDGTSEITDLDKTNSNKEIVTNFVNDILFGKAPEKVTNYVSTKEYLQHNPMIKDGLDGLGEAINYLTSQNNMFKYKKLHKVLGEGNFVLTMSEGEWNGKSQAFYDLFRLKNDKIVEHWDVIQEIPKEMAHTNGKF